MSLTSEEQLLAEVKEEIRITWEDEDSRIARMIARGKNRIKELAGPDVNFEGEGLAKDLLLNYCRYAYNNAVEYFETNFHREIVRLQLQKAVEDHVEQE